MFKLKSRENSKLGRNVKNKIDLACDSPVVILIWTERYNRS